MSAICPECQSECREEDLVKIFPCQCQICFHCLLHVHGTSASREQSKHCDQVLTGHQSARLVKKRGRDPTIALQDQVAYLPQAPPSKKSKTVLLQEKLEREGTATETLGSKGLLVTEQTLLQVHPKTQKLHAQSAAFSAVDAGGNIKDDDFETKKQLATHF